MDNSRKIVKVFLASPGDLSDERRAAKLVVDEFNALTADEFGFQVELVGWEDTVAVFGRPQEVINRDLERCELFIGMMWKKWGTAPDVSGAYSSGFEEEFELSVKRRLKEGKPEISLLFKEIDPVFLADPGEDLKKVLAFKSKLIAEKTILFERFTDVREFERRIRRCIWNYVRRLRQQELEQASLKTQAPTTGGENQQTAETARSPSDTPLSVEGTAFLREFISKTEHEATGKAISASEVARFRLLSTLIGKQGNDDHALGVHDANLLFSDRHRFTFGDRELTGLVSTGLRHFSHANTPMWYWFAAIDGFARQILPYYSLIGTEAERHVGALQAMRLINEPLPDEHRGDFLGAWFDEKVASKVKVAALEYLAECGLEVDLAYIRTEYDKSDNQTAGAAANAIIRINMRDGREKGIAALYELQPSSIDRRVLEELFDEGKGLSTETLVVGVGHKSSEVRRVVVGILRRRDALADAIAEQLLEDIDPQVRYEALSSLVVHGRAFTDAEARKVLTSQGTSRGGLRGLFRLGSYDPVAETYLERFREQRLHALKDKDLEAAVVDDPIFYSAAEFILAERRFDIHGEELRRRVDDQYKARFAEAVEALGQKLGSSAAELIERTRSLEDYTRKQLTRQGLDVICRQAKQEDLSRVRAALESGFVDYSNADIEYLRKFGEWQDIRLVIEAVKRPQAGRGLSLFDFMGDDAKYRVAAKTMCKLGRDRLAEVLVLPAPSSLLAHLVVEIAAKAFRELTDTSITRLLNVKSEDVRKATSLKCIRLLPSKRVAKLLGSYVSGEKYRYYNVIHWLDFGVSAPRGKAVLAAEKVLTDRWRS